jgi:2,4-dienoyl-CoA reductase-like NADH-dependent reductase (Old Yellow Enzyme family)
MDGAAMIAREASTPIISVGGYRAIEDIESALNQSDIAAISMGRPFICEPSPVKRWHDGDRRPSKCISCNGCFGDSFSYALNKR